MNRIVFTYLVFSILYSHTCSQETAQWKYFHPVESGIRIIHQDIYHNIWIGTDNGLLKYDWKDFTIYNEFSSLLPSADIPAISSDSHGNIWISCWDKIVKYDGVNWESFFIDDITDVWGGHKEIWSLAVDSRDILWAGAYFGLLKFDGIKWDHFYTGKSPIPPMLNEIRCVDIDEDNKVWMGCNTGVMNFDGDSTWNAYEDLARMNSIKAANNEEVWTGSNWLFKFNGTEWIPFNYIYGTDYHPPIEIFIQRKSFNGIDVDENNVKWFAGYLSNEKWPNGSQGFLSFDDTIAVEYIPDLTKNDVGLTKAILVDHLGNKWVGYDNGFIAVFNVDGVKGFSPTSADDESIPLQFSLSQNYPNPFNPATTIEYSIPVKSRQKVVGSRQITKDRNQNSYKRFQNQASSIQNQSSNHSFNQSSELVQLKVYDILGREVATLVDKSQPPGNYKVQWNAGNLASGVYFCRLKYGNFIQTRKMILLR